MKLFSEKVQPTSTNSSFNILQVKDFFEVFFGVYEIEINKSKYHAEKISDYDGNPVVSIPVVVEGIKKHYPFVLKKGKQEVLFNEHNTDDSLNTDNQEPSEEVDLVDDQPIVIEESQEEEPILYKNDEIAEQIKKAKKDAEKKLSAIRKKNLFELAKKSKENKKLLIETLEKARESLVDEFNIISNKIKNDIVDENDGRFSEIRETIDNRISELSENLADSTKYSLSSSLEVFEKSIKSLIEESTNAINPYIDKRIGSGLTNVSKVLGEKIDTTIDNKIHSLSQDINNNIGSIVESNVELHDKLNKGLNKALSRVGNVDKKIDALEISLNEELDEKISLAEEKITNYYNDKLSLIEEKTFDITEETRKYIVDLVQESRNHLLTEVRKLKDEKPVEYVIESNNKKDVINADELLLEFDKKIDKSINSKIDTEVTRLRKYIAAYSGGGSVAMQFADGGTMMGNLNVNGNLTVFGAISANQYLGVAAGGSDVSGLSANWQNTYTTVQANSATNWNYQGTDLKSLSANWQNTYTTVQANSATNWNYQGTDLKSLSANWQNTYTTVQANSATWSNVVSNATHTGDATGSTLLTLATVNGNVGSFGNATQVGTFTVNAKGLVTAAGSTTITPAVSSITGLGTNVAALLSATSSGTGGVVGTTSPTITTPTMTRSGNGTIFTASEGTRSLSVVTKSYGVEIMATASTVGQGAYFNANGMYEAWFYVTANTNTTGLRNMRFGNLSNRFSIQRLNDANDNITATPFSFANDAPTNAFYMSSSGGITVGWNVVGVPTDAGAGNLLVNGSTQCTTINGNTSSGGTLTLQSTTNATKGKILYGTSAYDEVNNRQGIGISTPLLPLHIVASNNAAGMFRAQNTAAGGYTGFELYGDAGTQLAAFGVGCSAASFYPGEMYLGTNTAKAVRVYTTSASNVRLSIHPTGGVSLGSLTDPGATNLLVAGTLAITGATTLTGNLISNGALITVPQELTTAAGVGVVNLTTLTTQVTTTGVLDALSLANGTVGQIKTIIHKAGAFTSILTPTTALGFTNITFLASLGQTCTLQYTSSGWVILSVGGLTPPVIA